MASRSAAVAVAPTVAVTMVALTQAQLEELAERTARKVLAEAEAARAAVARDPYTVTAAAEALGISVRSLRSAISLRRIRTIQPGGPRTALRIPADEVERLRTGRKA